MPAFRILRVGRPKWRIPRYKRVADSQDVEKSYEYDEDGDWQSEHSSRASSGSYGSEEAMLQPRSTSNRQPSRAYDDNRVPRKRFNILFTVILGSVLIVTALGLTLMGQSSTKAVASSAPHSRPPVWQGFPVLERYFGGLRKLLPRDANVAEYPSRPEDILDAIRKSTGAYGDVGSVIATRDDSQMPALPIKSRPFDINATDLTAISECFLDDKDTIRLPKLHVYDGIPAGFPDNVIGSFDELGLQNDICLDRFGRLGPYGLGYSRKYGGTSAGMEGDIQDADRVWEDRGQIDYRGIRWAELQQRCLEKNRRRFRELKSLDKRGIHAETGIESNIRIEESAPQLDRTAFVIRTWSGYTYDAEDIMFLRALISELSLESGSQFEVHFLVHVTDEDLQIWSNKGTKERLLSEILPKEFHGMATLWSEQQMSLIYGSSEETEAQEGQDQDNYRSTIMPLQYFAHEHPEYAFVWNWELDVRYTGHLHDLLVKSGAWAMKQPRKGLWERNARFYVPAEHGSWEDFTQMVRVETERSATTKPDLWTKFGIKSKSPALDLKPAQKPVWGPVAPMTDATLEAPRAEVMPPTSYREDRYVWGVGEDADFLTYSPIFNPESTGWKLGEEVKGYDTRSSDVSRRASMGTTTRLSRRLLVTMHHEKILTQHAMPPEMWPASVALHHGLKAVYVPMPMYIDRQWPVDYLAAIYNGGRNGASGGSRTSIFGDGREHNLKGTTWSQDEAGFGAKLWKRWLGYRVEGKGGEEWELALEGRMCLPPMLLHPVKQVDLVYEVEGTDD